MNSTNHSKLRHLTFLGVTMMRVHRLSRNMSLRELARRVGLDKSQLSRIERGEAAIGAEVAAQVAKELKVKQEELWK